ncbi:type II secretion system protein [Cytobacillus firmus]|uniref:type II secretion system protein n=1 Tax=Cytobacillus firmus TaxID=1399 RepID=UPI00222829F1|nr:hypothetical protein [Cytobacillus firmus]
MSIELSLLIAVFGVLISFLTYSLNKQKESKVETSQDAKVQAQLEYIGKGVDDIRIDLKANEKQMGALSERVTRLEESSKQAHKRIDTLEKESI